MTNMKILDVTIDELNRIARDFNNPKWGEICEALKEREFFRREASVIMTNQAREIADLKHQIFLARKP